MLKHGRVHHAVDSGAETQDWGMAETRVSQPEETLAQMVAKLATICYHSLTIAFNKLHSQKSVLSLSHFFLLHVEALLATLLRPVQYISCELSVGQQQYFKYFMILKNFSKCRDAFEF